MNYEEKLLHPKWQKKKSEILERDGYKCRSCGNEEVTLHAHHIVYLPETEPWDYNNDSLITLCEVCHNTEHLIGNTIRTYLFDVIKNNPLMIQMVAQLCVLSEKQESFDGSLRKFLKKEIAGYYKSKKVNHGETI